MKKSVFMIMVVAALASCSEDEFNDPVFNADGSLIALKSTTTTASASTRAPFEGVLDGSAELTAFVPASHTIDNSGTNADLNIGAYVTGTMTFTKAGTAVSYNTIGLSNADNAVFPTTPYNEEVNLFGLYPGVAAEWTLDKTNNTASYTFTGKQDVMAAPEVKVTKADVKAQDYETLAFTHLLTKIMVKIKADATAIATVGMINTIELVGNDGGTAEITNKVIYDPRAAADNVSFDKTATPVKALSFYGATSANNVVTYTDVVYNTTHEPGTTAALQAYAMVPPVVATSGTVNEYWLKITRNVSGNPQTNYVPFDLVRADNNTPFTGSTAGNSFTVVVNFTKDDIKAIATVTDWVDNGEYVSGVPVI